MTLLIALWLIQLLQAIHNSAWILSFFFIVDCITLMVFGREAKGVDLYRWEMRVLGLTKWQYNIQLYQMLESFLIINKWLHRIYVIWVVPQVTHDNQMFWNPRSHYNSICACKFARLLACMLDGYNLKLISYALDYRWNWATFNAFGVINKMPAFSVQKKKTYNAVTSDRPNKTQMLSLYAIPQIKKKLNTVNNAGK